MYDYSKLDAVIQALNDAEGHLQPGSQDQTDLAVAYKLVNDVRQRNLGS